MTSEGSITANRELGVEQKLFSQVAGGFKVGLVCRRYNVLTFKPSLFPIDCSHGAEENSLELSLAWVQVLLSHWLAIFSIIKWGKLITELTQRLVVEWNNMYRKWKVKVAQSSPTLFDPMDYTVHGIFQARILEWVAVPFFRGSSYPRDRTQVSYLAGGFFTSWATREAHKRWSMAKCPISGSCLWKHCCYQVLFLLCMTSGSWYKLCEPLCYPIWEVGSMRIKWDAVQALNTLSGMMQILNRCQFS